MQEVFNAQEELFEEFNNEPSVAKVPYHLEFPCRLDEYWAKKKNRTHLSLSLEITRELIDVFKRGQGSKNKAVRYSAERAAMELRMDVLENRWDQRLICSMSKIKSFFGRKYQAEEKENDASRANQPVAHTAVEADNSYQSRQERREELVKISGECVEAVLGAGAPTLAEATLSHFSKAPPALLKAFIKCHDESAMRMDIMPKKGTLRDAKDGVKCKRTKRKLLIEWAHALRGSPCVAEDQSSPEEDAVDFLFQQATNEQQEDFCVVEDCLHDVALQKTSDVVEFGEDGGSDSGQERQQQCSLKSAFLVAACTQHPERGNCMAAEGQVDSAPRCLLARRSVMTQW